MTRDVRAAGSRCSSIAECGEFEVAPLTVSDAEATAACVRLAEDPGQMIEPACGIAPVPLYARHRALAGVRHAVAVVCGGQVVTLGDLARWQGEQVVAS
ncbi:hypothetical protein [Tahibacter sp.]|uniref:hypothetical protein n=1 Tax=Tahibacter sp. TaxID=2056211 RepID=UPI0028C3782D|nr:hypothetical protein [Tahibacter sp.]